MRRSSRTVGPPVDYAKEFVNTSSSISLSSANALGVDPDDYDTGGRRNPRRSAVSFRSSRSSGGGGGRERRTSSRKRGRSNSRGGEDEADEEEDDEEDEEDEEEEEQSGPRWSFRDRNKHKREITSVELDLD